MATIVASYAYTDATVLDPDGHNQNIYSGVDGEGLMSEPNGGINADNFHADFEVLSEHIFPFSLVYAAQRRGDRSRHYYSDICGDGAESYICIDALRFRLPFDADTLRIMASFFVSPWLWNSGGQSTTIAARTALFFDGVALTETKSVLPGAARSTALFTAYDNTVGRFAVQRSYSRTLEAPDYNLSRDDHELSLRLYLQDAPITSSSVMVDSVSTGYSTKLHGRVSLGRPSITVMAFKSENGA